MTIIVMKRTVKNQSDLQQVWSESPKGLLAPSKLFPYCREGFLYLCLIPLGRKTVSSCPSANEVQSCWGHYHGSGFWSLTVGHVLTLYLLPESQSQGWSLSLHVGCWVEIRDCYFLLWRAWEWDPPRLVGISGERWEYPSSGSLAWASASSIAS